MIKLKEVVFQCGFPDVKWVTAALETVPEHRDLQRISIRPYSTLHSSILHCATIEDREMVQAEEAEALRQWPDLDPLLIQLWESHSICTQILFPRPGPNGEGRGVADWSEYLLPESTKRGIIDLVESRDSQ